MPTPRTLAPIHPNAGTEAAYRRKLYALIREMQDSVLYWVKAAYRANQPAIAQDEVPAAALRRALRRLERRWQKRFNELAPSLADQFATTVSKQTTSAMQRGLKAKNPDLTVRFKMTDAQRDILHATVNDSVSLIRSIPQQYFKDVTGDVMRSVQTGRDLGTLTKALEENYGVTRRRAAFIARSQNNIATAAMTRARQVEIGITECQWVHSAGGKTPRPSHVAASNRGQRYDPAKGWFDPDAKEWIWPGMLPNCRCVSRAVVPGFS